MRIGVISDTHNFFDERIVEIFKEVDHILHGGDVGLPCLITRLEEIAPLTAVLGNTDSGIPLRETEIVHLGERKFLIHHIVNPRASHEAIGRRIAREKPDVVVFGHTHKPFSQTIDGVLYLNPGYAGRTRFNMPRSVAILDCGKNLEVEFKPL
jgi:putative phosphoesterase